MNHYNEIVKFLHQAKNGNLSTSDFATEYNGTKIKVSFGKGNQARIPWIAFLKDNQTVSNGIYPVYLYYKDKGLLILAYGVSETNVPDLKWNIPNLKSIQSFFLEKNLGQPDRYGDSFVFKVYHVDQTLDEKEINDDLRQIILKYEDTLATSSQRNLITEDFDHRSFIKKCEEIGFQISDDLCIRYVASLLTKPFVILTGLSGSGKTKLALCFAKWLSESNRQICVIPVGADWTNREPLLGYPNALEAGKYVLPESGAIQLILDALKPENAKRPYFLILDEMNLSHVERYFADFLSAMESGEPIFLHANSPDWNDEVPSQIVLPKNVFIVGTVNVDETTYMFSPKVLDRANVIEFRISDQEMQAFLSNRVKLAFSDLNSSGSKMSMNFMQLASAETAINTNAEFNEVLIRFFKLLQQAGAEFGYRSAVEILRLSFIIRQLNPELSLNTIFDIALLQKLLPKVHGSRRKLEPILKALGALCLVSELEIEDILSSKTQIDNGNLSRIKYPLSLSKIKRMYTGLLSNGFTSYAEA